jgi:hypothetical protein
MLRRPKHSTIEVVAPKEEEREGGGLFFRLENSSSIKILTRITDTYIH